MKLIRALGKSIHLDFRGAASAVRRFPGFWRDYQKIQSEVANATGNWVVEPNYPCLMDLGDSAGTASGHYFHQDLHVARRVFSLGPSKHVDVGSRVDGFVAHVATFRDIEVLDIRPVRNLASSPIRFRQADLMNLPGDLVGCSDSVSCLHALEHFGLGRYGDRVNINGHIAGLQSLLQMVQASGRLHLSVPVGRQRIEFNAHRIFSPRTVLDLVSASATCVMFSYVDDRGDLHADVGLADGTLRLVEQLRYGCGIFEFVKN